MRRGQRRGFRHTEAAKQAIAAGARGLGRGGFNVRTTCTLCQQEMSPANLAKHRAVCAASRGKILNGKELSVRDIKNLRRVLKPAGWTVDEYVAVHNQQGGRCFLCGNTPVRGRLSADHCHASGRRRRLLCEACNLGLGAFRDDVELLKKAAEYLAEFDSSSGTE